MKNYKIMFALLLSLLLVSTVFTQSNSSQANDESMVKKAALDYVDGYYSGDVARMEKAIHPDINKAAPRDLPKTGRTLLAYSTYQGLLDLTRNKTGFLPDTARHIDVKVLNIDNNLANARVISASFIDYIQLVKIEDQWKIINVIYTNGLNGPKRIKDFDAEKERSGVQQTIVNYLTGLYGADAGNLNLAVTAEFNKVSFTPLGASGKTTLRKQRYDTFIENALSGIGKYDEVYRDYDISVIDIMDGLAVVQCSLTGTTEYLQLYKTKDSWKILNCFVLAKTNLTVADAMTVTAGNPMPDFTLPVYGGGQFKLSDYAGKNVLLIFPRGWTGNAWCSYCPYQYLELEELQKTADIEKKHNVKIAFVMPYSSERIKDWMAKFPDGLTIIENVKNPQNPPAPGSLQEAYSNWAKLAFPIKFSAQPDDKHTIIPVLVDEKHNLSKQMKIYTRFWDGIAAEQNVASVLIIDKYGILQLKYIGQMTEDRPSVKYLLNFIDKLN